MNQSASHVHSSPISPDTPSFLLQLSLSPQFQILQLAFNQNPTLLTTWLSFLAEQHSNGSNILKYRSLLDEIVTYPETFINMLNHNQLTQQEIEDLESYARNNHQRIL